MTVPQGGLRLLLQINHHILLSQYVDHQVTLKQVVFLHFFLLVMPCNYNAVCGKIKGYQKGTPLTFDETATYSLNNYYVEGISITLGYPRKHVWTYAVG